MLSRHKQFSWSGTDHEPAVWLPGCVRPQPAQHRKWMRQYIADDLVQLRFAASGSACRINPEIDCTWAIQSCKRFRSALDAGLEGDLMDRAENDTVALGNGEQPSGLVCRLS